MRVNAKCWKIILLNYFDRIKIILYVYIWLNNTVQIYLFTILSLEAQGTRSTTRQTDSSVINIPITNGTVELTRSKRIELSTIRNIIYRERIFSPFLSSFFFFLLFRPRVILINSRGRDSQRGEFIKTACFYRRQPWDTQLCVQAGNSWTFVGALRYARARRWPVDL